MLCVCLLCIVCSLWFDASCCNYMLSRWLIVFGCWLLVECCLVQSVCVVLFCFMCLWLFLICCKLCCSSC